MKICMIGTGYVGLVSGTCFADLGNKVYCVDKDKIKINKLKNSVSPIYESGLDDLIRNYFRAKRLDFTDDLENAVQKVLNDGLRTKDILSKSTKEVSTETMGNAIIACLQK